MTDGLGWHSLCAILLVARLATACGGSNGSAAAPGDEPGVVQPTNASERELLQKLETLVPGVPHRIGNVTVVAEPAYYAASGRLCRGVTLTPPGGRQSNRQLACKQDRQWVFVPNVLITPVGAR